MVGELSGNFRGPISIRIEGPPSMIGIVADPFNAPNFSVHAVQPRSA
jgi:hypothetical protein